MARIYVHVTDKIIATQNPLLRSNEQMFDYLSPCHIEVISLNGMYFFNDNTMFAPQRNSLNEALYL